MRAWKNICFGKGDKMIKMKRKAQEEIIGFILIVVLVAVIFLVYLGITIRQKAPITQKESGDVAQFLESLMDYTTGCAIGSDTSFISLGELVKECYSGSSCRDGENTCKILIRTIKETVESNWRIGADRPVKGYIFNSTYNSGTTMKNIAFESKGNCTSERIGAEHLSPAYPGNIRSSLEICY